MPAPLARHERDRLAELEAVIHAGLRQFHAVGKALCEIRDGRLYRRTHDTFEAYCQERWGFGKSHGYRLIAAAEVADEVSSAAENCPPLGDDSAPARVENERQARRILDLQRKALAALPPEEQVEAVEREERAVLGRAAAEARQVGGAQTEATLRGAVGCCRQLVRRLRKLGGEYDHLTTPAEALLTAIEAAAAELPGG